LPSAQTAHLVLPQHTPVLSLPEEANASQNQKSRFCQRTDNNSYFVTRLNNIYK